MGQEKRSLYFDSLIATDKCSYIVDGERQLQVFFVI